MSSSFVVCNITSIDQMYEKAYTGVYYYLMPFYFILTFFGRLLSLMAFYVQSKKESIYLLQIFIAAVESFECLSFSLYTMTRYVLTLKVTSNLWFRGCYICMWYDTHLASCFQMGSMLCSLILSICMTSDRIYALAFPIKYNKNFNRKKQQWLLFWGAIFISFAFTFFIGFIYNLRYNEDENIYIQESGPWLTLGFKYIQAHTSMKLTCVIILIVLDVILACLFHFHMKKKSLMMTNEEKNNMKKVKTLVLLTLIQSILNISAVMGGFVYNLFNFLSLMFPIFGCVTSVMGPFIDMNRAVCDMATFYVMLALTKSFRKMVRDGLKEIFCGGKTTTAVVPIRTVANQ